ncbi:MAG: helix-turn-helix transcriptional regulator [Deltaproteobacteria bacterium]|nr:helix-turn-helix transcriptional regulator [Deltaproteobacteria bacterium]
MTFGKKLRQLRKEKEWSQDELSARIGIDGRHISRYENGKFMPSADVIVKIAQAFNVSIDYLLFEDSPKAPLKYKNRDLIEKVKSLDNISDKDNETLLNIIDAISARNQLKTLAGQVG